MFKALIFISLLLSTVVLSSCAEQMRKSETSQTPVRNVILFIGDGMGPQQIGLLLSYARQAPHSVLTTRQTAFDRLLRQGSLSLSLTYADNVLVADSAASASQLATGESALSETLGLNNQGEVVETLIETAKKAGKVTGLVSDTRITHATPAGFAAHQTHRRMENAIAEQLLTTQAEVMLSAGLSYYLPKAVNNANSSAYSLWQARLEQIPHSKRQDDKDLLTQAEAQGYQLLFNQAQLQNTQAKKLLGLFADEEMPDALTEHQHQNHQQPTLAEMSLKALNTLNAHAQGFFLMVEAGQIDWASHHNDTGLLLHEMLRANATLETILNWLVEHDDTLLIVTADHETGGFGFSYSAYTIPQAITLTNQISYQPNFNFGQPRVLDDLYQQHRSYHQLFKQFDALPKAKQTAHQLMELVNTNSVFKITEQQAQTILTVETNPYYQTDHEYLYAKQVPKMPVHSAFFPYQQTNRENLLAQALAEQQQAVWATGTHTSTPVYLFAYGKQHQVVDMKKIWHHRELGQLLKRLLTTH